MNIPSIDFQLGEELDMLRDMVHDMAQNDIAPLAAEADEKSTL